MNPKLSKTRPSLLRWAWAAALLAVGTAQAVDFATYQRQRDNADRYRRLETGAIDQMLQQTLAGNAARAAARDRRFQDFYRAVQDEEAARRGERGVSASQLPSARTPAQIVAELRRLAEAGDAAAARTLGQAMSSGTGTPVDKAGAARWFARAADGGDTIAQAIWGSMLAFGAEGVARNPPASIPYLRAAANAGDAMAMANLAFAHLRGHGVPENEAEAVGWFRRAAAAGSVEGKLGWGDALVFGKGGTPRNPDEGVRLLREAAAAGNSDARLLVGGLAANGRVAGLSAAEGAQMVLAAAQAGNAQAQRLYGTLALEGSGTSRDPNAAVRWFEPLARDGDGMAAWYLCAGWLNGQIGREPARSRPWCEAAARLGHPDAKLAWAEHLRGQHGGAAESPKADSAQAVSAQTGSAKAGSAAAAPPAPAGAVGLAEALDMIKGPLFVRNSTRGMAALESLAQAGDPAAQFMLGELLSGMVSSFWPADKRVALGWYRRAVEGGHLDAKARLGVITAKGELGLTADVATGQRMLREAVEGGSAFAMGLLATGHLLADAGFARDFPTAARWARASAEGGDAYGMLVWHFMLKGGTGVTADPAAALKWLKASLAKDYGESYFYMGQYHDPYQRNQNLPGIAKDMVDALRHYEIAATMGSESARAALRTAKARETARAAPATSAGNDDRTGRDTFLGALRAAREVGFQAQDVNESSLRARLSRSHEGVPVWVDLSVHGRRVSADVGSADDAVRTAYIRALRQRLDATLGGVVYDGNITWR